MTEVHIPTCDSTFDRQLEVKGTAFTKTVFVPREIAPSKASKA